MFIDVKTSLAGLFNEKCPQKVLRLFWEKKEKTKKCPPKRPFWKKSKKLKYVLRKRYGSSGEKSKQLKNVLKQRYGRIETWNNLDYERLRIIRGWPLTILK